MQECSQTAKCTVDDLALAVLGVDKSRGNLVYSHTLEYLQLLQENAYETDGASILSFQPDAASLDENIFLGRSATIVSLNHVYV